MSELQKHIRDLPVNERIALVAFIIQSIQEDQQGKPDINIPTHIAEEWAKESNELVEKMKSGEIKTTSWESIKTNLFAKYGI